MDVHAKLRARAEQSGLSLSEYLRRELAHLADPTLADVLSRAARSGRGGITAERAVARGSGRSMIVVDASVLLPALSDPGRDGEQARRRLLEEPELHAPHHVISKSFLGSNVGCNAA